MAGLDYFSRMNLRNYSDTDNTMLCTYRICNMHNSWNFRTAYTKNKGNDEWRYLKIWIESVSTWSHPKILVWFKMRMNVPPQPIRISSFPFLFALSYHILRCYRRLYIKQNMHWVNKSIPQGRAIKRFAAKFELFWIIFSRTFQAKGCVSRIVNLFLIEPCCVHKIRRNFRPFLFCA